MLMDIVYCAAESQAVPFPQIDHVSHLERVSVGQRIIGEKDPREYPHGQNESQEVPGSRMKRPQAGDAVIDQEGDRKQRRIQGPDQKHHPETDSCQRTVCQGGDAQRLEQEEQEQGHEEHTAGVRHHG